MTRKYFDTWRSPRPISHAGLRPPVVEKLARMCNVVDFDDLRDLTPDDVVGLKLAEADRRDLENAIAYALRTE